MDNRILNYENYKDTIVYLSGFSRNIVKASQLQSISLSVKNLETKELVSDTLFEQLFQQSLINGWKNIEVIRHDTKYYEKDFFVREYKENIGVIKAATRFYDLGKIDLNSQFDTYLVFSIYTHYGFRSNILYLLNIFNGQVRSITEISNYHCDNNGYCTQFSIQKLKNGFFLLKHEITSSDIIYSDEISKEEMKEIEEENAPVYCRFGFDKDGYVVVEN